MKQIYLLLLLLSCTTAFAQNKTYKYDFFYSTKDKTSQGLDLEKQCTGSYSYQSIPTITTGGRVGFNFDKGCGLVFLDSTTNLLSAGNYTIELFFKIDTVKGYKKLIDYNNLNGDKGLYNFGGKISLYPKFTSADSVVAPNKFQYVAITRNATTKKMYMYFNNDTVGSYVDNAGDYVYGTNKRITFFRDDVGTGGEQAAGAVVYIAISNYEMDIATVKANYNNLSATLSVNEISAGENNIIVSPNPAKESVSIKSAVATIYELYDMWGKKIKSGTLQEGYNTLSLRDISQGVYTLITAYGNSRIVVE